jgi:hypothetical protein
MKHIRKRITDLLEWHEGTYPSCPGCSICEEIETLRKHLDREPAEKFKHILSKGQDMTKSDIALLIDNDVQKNVIKKYLNMHNEEFYDLMERYGFSNRRKKKVGDEMARETLNIDIDEFIQLHHVEGKSFSEIEKEKGLKTPAFANWRWRKKQEIQSALDSLQIAPESTEKQKEGVSSSEEKERAQASQMNAITKRDMRIRELENDVDRWKRKYEEANDACADLENEIEHFRPSPVDDNNHLKRQIELLQAELAPLRQLAYIKLKQDIES